MDELQVPSGQQSFSCSGQDWFVVSSDSIWQQLVVADLQINFSQSADTAGMPVTRKKQTRRIRARNCIELKIMNFRGCNRFFNKLLIVLFFKS